MFPNASNDFVHGRLEATGLNPGVSNSEQRRLLPATTWIVRMRELGFPGLFIHNKPEMVISLETVRHLKIKPVRQCEFTSQKCGQMRDCSLDLAAATEKVSVLS